MPTPGSPPRSARRAPASRPANGDPTWPPRWWPSPHDHYLNIRQHGAVESPQLQADAGLLCIAIVQSAG
ncbi:hypothetical protein LNQ03_02050 [Klebsiella pneumoniae subsp. pneumoniae]|nr:hypothetical protein [Klebsiella pneumoniae subsp. pneumoniae]